MHEYGLAKQIAELALAQAAEHGATRVRGVELLVGDFNNIVPDALRFHLEAISKGTHLEGAAIKIKRQAMLLKCHACGKEGTPRDALSIVCPHCDGLSVEIVGGKDLSLVAIEVD